jgi:hypothetical protein
MAHFDCIGLDRGGGDARRQRLGTRTGPRRDDPQTGRSPSRSRNDGTDGASDAVTSAAKSSGRAVPSGDDPHAALDP